MQEDVKAAAKAALQSRGLGAGGARKRLRLVEKETKRLHQVSPLQAGDAQDEATFPLFLSFAANTRSNLEAASKDPLTMSQVLAHPQYRSDPIAAITSHLSATLPPPPEAPKPKPDPSMRKQQKALRKWKQKLQGPMSMAEDSD